MEQHYSPPITETLGDCYSNYQQSREHLHSLELNCADQPVQIDVLDKVLDAKAQIAKAAMEMYRKSEDTSIEVTNEEICKEGFTRAMVSTKENHATKLFFAALNNTRSRFCMNIPS